MTNMELLAWVRGPGLTLAIVFMLLGVMARLLTMLMLGRKADLSEARESNSYKFGLRTIFTRSLPPLGAGRGVPIPLITAYIFHIGLLLIVFFFVPHILFITDLTGVGWGGLPFWLIDGVTLVTMIAMLISLWYRWANKVRRFLSTFSDYFVWLITFLPVLTGYMLYHRQLLPYNDMLIVHIITIEILLVCLPLTKLMHAFTFAFARYYNGQANGRKGVKV